VTEEQIKHMRDRFLHWTLPSHFKPDNGISFDPSVPHPACPPVGTNLFTSDQADAMVRYMIEGMAGAAAPLPEWYDDAVRLAWSGRRFYHLDHCLFLASKPCNCGASSANRVLDRIGGPVPATPTT
jgi:hypothetical protein